MSLKQRIRDDETGFAIVIAVALIALLSTVAVALPLLVQNEDSKSRRDQVQDSAYQAAEAGTNAVLSDLTQSTAFFKKYLAKGEATRTFNSTTYANDCVTGSTSTTQSTCIDKDVSAVAWASPWWTYATSATARASDPGWYSLGNGYQYLIQLYPPSTSLTGLAQTITRIDVTGRPFGSTDTSKWRTIETQIRPSSLTDFQAFVATALAYAAGATTTGPVFVGEDNSGTKYNLQHAGTATANLYAEGTVTVGGSTLQNGAQKYDSGTNPNALCKLNGCAPVPFTNFSSTFSKVSGAASCPVSGTPAGPPSYWCFGTTDPNNANAPVDAWWIRFLSNGKATFTPCKQAVVSGNPKPIYDNTPTCGTTSAQYTLPANGAIYSSADVIVSGVVKGQITVATAGNVYLRRQSHAEHARHRRDRRGGAGKHLRPGVGARRHPQHHHLLGPVQPQRRLPVQSGLGRRGERDDELLRLDGGLRHHTVRLDRLHDHLLLRLLRHSPLQLRSQPALRPAAVLAESRQRLHHPRPAADLAAAGMP